MQLYSVSKYSKTLFSLAAAAIIIPFIFIAGQAVAQERLETPVKLKVEDGSFEEVSVVINNITTGESQTIPGDAHLDIILKLNCDYVLSFAKPGYITKKIALNTNAPADRVAGGFYPFNFEVNLFKQYEGVNIVIFNQPVGKISFNRLIDDFDYDTDYTKQIQSALKVAEDEIKQKQKEARAQAELLKKEQERKKAEDAAQAKLLEKEKLELEKKAAQEAKEQAALAAKEKKAQEEQQKKEAKAALEEERQRAFAKMEEEERAKAKAFEESEARKKNTGIQGNEAPVATKPQGSGEDIRGNGLPGSGIDLPVTASVSGNGEDFAKSKPAIGTGDELPENSPANANKGSEKGFTKAVAVSGGDSRPEMVPEAKPVIKPVIAPAENFETLPDISTEEIVELNRIITKVTVRKNQKETVFSKVKYNWGGLYYFRQNTSISESLFFMNTGHR
jgi:hypothetical protein